MKQDMEPQEVSDDMNSLMTSANVQELANLLKNPLILERVLFHASFADLLNYRLVSHFWNRYATPILCEKRAFVKVHLGSPKLNSLLSSAFHCTSFNVIGDESWRWQLYPTDEEEKPKLDFFKKISPWITSLHFGNIFEGQLYRSARKTLSHHPGLCFPHLKSLTAHLIVSENGSTRPDPEIIDRDRIKIFKSNLLLVKFIQKGATPGLQLQLSLSTSGLIDPIVLGEMLEAVNQHGDAYIYFLWTTQYVSDQDLRTLADSGLLQLKTFYIMLPDNFPTTKFVTLTLETLVWFLESQCSTLESLGLQKWLSSRVKKVVTLSKPFPRLTSLQVQVPLRVATWTDYAHVFPALESLMFPGTYFKPVRAYALDLRNTTPMRTVTKLQYSINVNLGDDPSGHMISKIARVFPRLKKLTLPAQRSVMKKVYRESWTRLEELELVWESWGRAWPECCPDEALMQVRRYGGFEFQKRTTSLFQRVHSRMKPAPLLKQLKVLRLKPIKQNCFPLPPHTNVLSDAACQLVLLQLDNLTCLDLRGCEGQKFFIVSPEMIHKMQKKFEVLL